MANDELWYHGERGEFKPYTPIYFSDSMNRAIGYAKSDQNGTITTARLHFKNPKIEKSAPMQIYSKEIMELKKAGHDALIQTWGKAIDHASSGKDAIVLDPNIIQIVKTDKIANKLAINKYVLNILKFSDSNSPNMNWHDSYGRRRTLSKTEAESYVSSGSVPVTRSEGYVPESLAGATQDTKGVYYYIGNEESPDRLQLGNTLIVNTKIDGMLQLGQPKEKILEKLNYYFDKKKEGKDEFLAPYIKGKTRRWYGDWADVYLGQEAKKKGFDSIILLQEPNLESHEGGVGTEIIDLRGIKLIETENTPHPKVKTEKTPEPNIHKEIKKEDILVPKDMDSVGIRAFVRSICKFAQLKIDYVYISEEDMPDQELLDEAWSIARTSGINILRNQDLHTIAVLNGHAVGALFVSNSGPNYSFDVVVHPKYQRQGIGFELAKIGNNRQHEDGFEVQFPEGLKHKIVSPGGERLVQKLKSLDKRQFVLNICKFAQQQKLLDFDPPESFSEKPQEHPELRKELTQYTPEGTEEEEYIDGFYHVTTNLPAVLQWGALKSRKQLGGNVPGLGGGDANEAWDKISLTHSLDKANTIFHGLIYAAKICSNQLTTSDIFNSTLSEYNFPEDALMESDVKDFLENWMTAEEMGEDGENIDQLLDQRIKTPKEKYDFLTRLEAILNTQMENYDMSFTGPPVGLTVPFETFCQLNPKNIAILKMQVRKGAPYQHVPQELELRLNPDDVRLSDDAIVETV